MGRQAELKNLSGCLSYFAAEGSGSCLVEVIGEAGIGKSAVLRKFVDLANAEGMVVLTGGAASGPWDTPFGTVENQDEAAARGRDPRHGDRAFAPAPEGDRPKDRHQNLRSLLAQPVAKKVVLVLDDLHKAGSIALELIANQLCRPPEAPMMFVFGYRDRQAPVALQLAINGCSPEIPVTRLRLPPLSERDLDPMLAGAGPAGWRGKLYRESGGNPAYLRALLAEQCAASSPTGSRFDLGGRGPFEYAPFLAELAELPPAVRAVADAAAVAGDEFDAELVARMLGRDEPEVLHAIGELVGRDLVRPMIRGLYFAFRHPVVRRAVYHSGELSQRVRLHIEADNVLRARGAPAAERVSHVEQWANHGDLDAVEVLDAAARAVETTEPDRAASWLAAALRLLPQQPGLGERRGGLLIRLARARGMAGHLRECRDLMHAALRLVPQDTGIEHGTAVAFTAMVQRLLGAHAETDAMLRAEIAKVDDTTLASAALKFELAAGQLKTGDSAACCQWAQQALAIARQHQDRPLQSACLALLAKAGISDGHATAAAQHLAQATATLDAMLDDEFARSLDAVEWIGWAEIMLGRWSDALRHFDKAIDFAVRVDHRLTLPRLLLGQVFALRTRGRLAEAQAAAEHAVELAEHSGSPEQLYTAHAMRLWTVTIQGKVGGSTPGALVSIGQPRELVSSWHDMLALRMLAEARLLSGDHDGCLALVDTVGGADLPGCSAYTRVAWYELCTRAELAASRLDEAAKWAELATATAALVAQPSRTGLALLAQAQVQLAQAPETALPSARQAIARLAEAGLTVDALRARQVYGVSLSGEHQDDAIRELKATQLAFEQLGAAPLARCARTERRKLAARRPRNKDSTAAESADMLTIREQQVAELVREGLTNRLIAKRLYISEKTVEMHLSRVFAKLGVSSRAAVAAFVTREWPVESAAS